MSQQDQFAALKARIQAEFDAGRAQVTRTWDSHFVEFYGEAGERIATSFVQVSGADVAVGKYHETKIQWQDVVDADHVRLRLLIEPDLPIHQGVDFGPYYNGDGWEWDEFDIVVHRDLLQDDIHQ
jgi:hypothetical protein